MSDVIPVANASAVRADRWFAAYAADHQHPLNQRLHQWCVPAILWSLIVLLYLVPVGIPGIGAASQGAVAWAASLAAMCFWTWLLPWRLVFTMAVTLIACLASSVWLLATLDRLTVLLLAVTVFVLAWAGQFIGHHVEGRRPSFLTDLVYLMIGPPWVATKILGGKS